MNSEFTEITRGIVGVVGQKEIDIVGEPITDILIANELAEDESNKIKLTNAKGGYDLSAPEVIIQILFLIIGFTTLGLQIYEQRKTKTGTDEKMNDLEKEIASLKYEVLKNRSELKSLALEKQIEICKEIINRK